MKIRSSARVSTALARTLILLAVCSALSGCTGSLRTPETLPDAPEGVHHLVRHGETLWRIARTYGVELSDLAAVNGIDDTSKLEAGRRLFIPGALTTRDVSVLAADSVPRTGFFSWPVQQGRLLSAFGVPRRGHDHTGIDIGAGFGQPVLASRSGRVTYAGSTMRGYGKTVIIAHEDAYSSLYAHNSALLVDEGDWVEGGQTIARIGRSGNASTEHCHFELRRNDVAVDPLPYLSRGEEGR